MLSIFVTLVTDVTVISLVTNLSPFMTHVFKLVLDQTCASVAQIQTLLIERKIYRIHTDGFKHNWCTMTASRSHINKNQ